MYVHMYIQIRSFLGHDSLSGPQHAYIKGCASLIGGPHRKTYVLQGIRFSIIPGYCGGFQQCILHLRRVEFNLSASDIFKVATKGAPQEGELSPYLWNLNVNTLLKAMERTLHKRMTWQLRLWARVLNYCLHL